MSWRQFLKADPEVLRVKRVLSPSDTPLKTLKTLKNQRTENKTNQPEYKALLSSEPQWQHDFCTAHAEFNNWKGCCPCSLDDCLLSRILDCDGNIDRIKGLPIGQGVNTDDVIQLWIESGETLKNIFKNPVWLLCIAEHLAKD